MKRFTKYLTSGIALASLGLAFGATGASERIANEDADFLFWSSPEPLVQQQDTNKLKLPIKPDEPYAAEPAVQSPLYLNAPSNVTTTVEYDPVTKQYVVYEKIGNVNVSPPRAISEAEFRQLQFNKSMRSYWTERRQAESGGRGSGILPRLQVGGEAFDRIFGSNTIEIIPQGSAELVFGITSTKTDNPTLSEDLRKNTTFDFQSKIQMNVTGTIGEKMRMDVNYDTEATFDFENNVKVEYTGFEDEILQKIEAGNVSLPLPGTLITGSQSLFGFKTEMKFGRLSVTSIFSRQNGQTQVIEVKGGAQSKEFEISADEYEANKHFFLSQYFRETYDQSLRNLPIINSGVNITRVEVWITNRQSNFDNSRNVVAFVDLAENQRNIFETDIFYQTESGEYPSNTRNNLYELMTTGAYSGIRSISDVTTILEPLSAQGFLGGKDYEKVENARKLGPSEYTLNAQLGYISLNAALNADEVLAVAYEYTLGGRTFRVGELSTDGVNAPEALIVKLLKGTNLTPKLPTWKLMMKNIYNIGAYQVSQDEFYLDILYQNDETGAAVNYIPEGNIANKPLISVLNLDNLNSQQAPSPDGVFDFMQGITINPANGRVIFPVLEPFGRYLENKIGNPAIAEKYVYKELYDSTLTKARQVADKNKFKFMGSYRSSSSSEISLNAPNVPQGSVVVTAGGMKLTENVDYTVDYNLGTVKIINQGLMESGTPIKISLESNALFNFQTKTLVGSHFDYRFSDDFNIGATILNLTERPLTQKVNFGNEAISNTIWGLNTSFKTESRLLTAAVDLLPFIETKEKSTITFDAEFAHFLPGHSRSIGKDGTVYIDDFEASKTSIDLRTWSAWTLASTPQGQNDMFPEGNLSNDLAYGYNRARAAWYTIDPLFLRTSSLTPGHIRRDENTRNSHFVREIYEKEIFPNKNTPQGLPTNIPVLNFAFYPDEKGPYNFDVNAGPVSRGITAEGKLNNPETRWGGIMRSVPMPDFEAANIEYIEFWMMDPFVYDTLHTGGDLFFNLGNVSEDILRDGKKSFENGLPTSAIVKNVDTTAWGRVPIVQSLVNAFDNDPQTRRFQDVGLDGLSSEDEASFYNDYLNSIAAIHGTASEAYQQAINDPSNDDYRYYRSSIYDELETGILDRYKKYNNPEGNSPTAEQSPESYTTSATTIPDGEDINRDNTLSDNEAYYQYRISLRHTDMKVGHNFITNKVKYTPNNGDGTSVNWYQFKVPIQEFERVVGPIQDFKSIRFMRMFMRGFTDTTILRFATLELVRGEWRKYNLSLIQGQEGMPENDLAIGSFDISAVNIEENDARTPVNYVLPPGVDRVIDPSQPQLTELNEQSMELKILDLADGDARATFKNVNLDIRQYRYLKMDVHAEAIEGMSLNDGEVTLFVRLGTDYTNNYYEYEVPLKLTPFGYYYNNRESHREIVWPRENLVDIDLQSLPDLKLARNDEMRREGSTVSYTTVYSKTEKGKTIKLTGNPNLSNVRVIMIGVRNRGKSVTPGDDGMPKSVVVWANELRLSHFNDKGGWAANARMAAKLADLGMVTVAGSTIKPGFGSIEKKVNERSTDDFYQYDVSSTIELGRFFPEKSGVKIPLYVGYSESFANPEYNPLDPDVPLKSALDNARNSRERDSIKHIAQDYNRRKSINLTNVKINKMEGTPRVWDISNFSVSYSYSEQFSRNIKTERRIQRDVRGALTYNYNARPKSIVPFKKVKWMNAPYLRIVKDFNFNLIPSQLSFRTDLNRTYFEQQLRNINNPQIQLIPTYSKDFVWNRVYAMNWDIAQSLKFDFTASNIARIDEPDGMVDRRRDHDQYMHWRDSVFNNILSFGRNTMYNHQFNLTYTIPINKIPFLNWTSATARYSGTYRWNAGPILPDTSRFDPGNTIQNSNNMQVNGQLNLLNLYNKIGYLKRVNQKFDQLARGGQLEQRKYENIKYEEKEVRLKEGLPKTIYHRLGTEDVSVKVFDEMGKEVKAEVNVRNDQRITIRSSADVDNARIVVDGKVLSRSNPLKIIGETSLRVLMGVKNVAISYTETNGSTLPGYKPGTNYLGMDRLSAAGAPGFPFVLGWQDKDFAWRASENGWLSTDTTLNAPYALTHNENLTIRSTIEPFPGLRIELNGTRTYAKNHSELYLANRQGNFGAYNPLSTGSFSISIISIGSAFEKSNSDNDYLSEAFEQFKNNRIIIAQRLANNRAKGSSLGYNPNVVDAENFPDGYSSLSQEVLLPAFLAAYTNKPASSIGLSDFKSIPMPNWQVTYDGLAKLKMFKSFLRTFTLTHGYRSVYTIGSFTSNLDYWAEEDGFSYVRDKQDINFLPKREIVNVSISEQFSPLIGMDMNWHNSLTTRAEVKSSRSLALSLANNQLSEIKSWEYIIGAGYRFENVPLIFGSSAGKQRTLKSDLRLRVDLSIRNNQTIMRKLVEDTNTPIAGQQVITLKNSADYVVSDQVTIRLFFDRVINKPLVSLTFPTANTSFGFSVRFTMAQ